MITEENIKEMLELMPYISKIIEEYKIFCKEHPEVFSEMEREMAKTIYSIAKKMPQVIVDCPSFPEIFNHKDENTGCIEE